VRLTGLQRFDTLGVRIAVVLLLGLLAAQWTSERLYQEERQQAWGHLVSGPLAHRLDTVAGRLDATPRAERGELVAVLSSPRIRFSLDAAALTARPSGVLAPLANSLTRQLGVARHIGVAAGEPDRDGDGLPDTLRITLALADGQVLAAEHRFSEAAALQPSRHLPLLFGYFVAIAAISLLALLWAVRPLKRLERAADALGRDLSGPPLEENGPREVRQAARAFNTMQTRLASFMDERLRILSAVSHDLKTPITRLKMRAELLADERQRDKILADLDDMETLLAATLDFLRGEARSEAGVPVDVDALLASIADDFGDMGQSVEWTGGVDAPLVARPQALKRCLTNLIENAVFYGGGARVSAVDTADALVIHIDDGGPGIADTDLEALFEPFRRGETSRNRATGGVGLGLAIARNLARAHGGEVRLANRAEGGLRASVTLPRGS